MSTFVTGADPLASLITTHPRVAVYTIETLSPTSVNVTEVPPLKVAGVITATPPPSISKTKVAN